MNNRTKSELEHEIDQIIDSIDIASERISSNFAQKVMERIASDADAVQRIHNGSLLFLRSVAAAVIVLIGINFYTIMSIRQNVQQTDSTSEVDENVQSVEVSEYDSFSLLAQDY
jgi:hypothetical protein